ncbi:hypothetical protein L9F63_026518, partial [Diploptera punctata]
ITKIFQKALLKMMHLKPVNKHEETNIEERQDATEEFSTVPDIENVGQKDQEDEEKATKEELNLKEQSAETLEDEEKDMQEQIIVSVYQFISR